MKMSLRTDLLFLILQFLGADEKYERTARMFEQESGIYFSMSYFERLILKGIWHEAEKYLSAFTKIMDNRHSIKTYFEIRKNKYFEALDRQDLGEASRILIDELKVFATINEESEALYQEMTLLLTMNNFRDHPALKELVKTPAAMRAKLLIELRKIFKDNPTFHGKLDFPNIQDDSRLETLMMQSEDWQRGSDEFQKCCICHMHIDELDAIVHSPPLNALFFLAYSPFSEFSPDTGMAMGTYIEEVQEFGPSNSVQQPETVAEPSASYQQLQNEGTVIQMTDEHSNSDQQLPSMETDIKMKQEPSN